MAASGLVLGVAQGAAADDATTVESPAETSSPASSSLASGISTQGAATASDAVARFVHAVLASTGFAAPDLSTCVCTVAVGVAVGGDAHALAIGGTAGGSDAALQAGDSGPAMAVSVSADGPADAEAASGNTGQAGGDTAGRAAPAVAPRGVTSAGRARVPQQKLDDAIRALVDALVRAAEERAGAELDGYDDDLATSIGDGLDASAGASLSVDLAVWSPTNGLRRDGGGCSPGADGVTVICAIALAISVGGAAEADAQPPTGSSGVGDTEADGLVVPSGAGWPGDAIAIAMSMGSRAAASADAGDAWIAAAMPTGPIGSASGSSGTTGSALSASLTTSGAAGAQARSGASGSVTSGAATADAQTAGGAGGSATAAGSSGSTGDALSLALGRAGAGSNASSGDSGAVVVSAISGARGVVDARVTGVDVSTLSPGTGGSASARGATGATGWSHALTLGDVVTSSAASGASGRVDSQANGGLGGSILVLDAAAVPSRGGTGGVATIEGSSGATGATLAIALAEKRRVEARSRSGDSGLVDVLATGGRGGCAVMRIDVVADPCTAPLVVEPAEQPSQQPAEQPLTPSVTVITPDTADVVVVATPADGDAPSVVAQSASSRSLKVSARPTSAPASATPSSTSSGDAVGTEPPATSGAESSEGAASHERNRLDSAAVAYRAGADPQGKDSPDVNNPRGAPANPAGVVLALITSLAIVLATVAMLIKYVKIKSARRRPRRT